MLKGEEIFISALQIDLERWFLDMLCNFQFSIDWHKMEQFLYAPPPAPSHPNFDDIFEFWPNVILTQKYQTHRQSKPPAQI